MTDDIFKKTIELSVNEYIKSGHSLNDTKELLKKNYPTEHHYLVDEIIENILNEVSNISSFKNIDGLRDSKNPKWYSKEKNEFENWKKYKHYLKTKKDPLPDQAIDNIDHYTDKIISQCSDPKSSNVNSKGLVVGYVQSGKTANFIGLLAKAADVGYNLIIVLTGTKEKLRRQTQQRIDSDLCSLNPGKLVLKTYEKSDFRRPPDRPEAWFQSNQTSILIVKKQQNILTNFINWVKYADNSTSQNKIEIPETVRSQAKTLIVDDEADEASINVSRYDGMSKIYEKIVTIRRTLPRSAFVGYTATPFANVLIDHKSFDGENLYPNNFIVSLPKPPNYFGAEEVFGRRRTESEINEDETSENINGKDMIRIIPGEEISNLKPMRNSEIDDFKPTINKSLTAAIKYYLLSTCIKIYRLGKNDHTTMFVHTHVRANVQIKTIKVIQEFISALKFEKLNNEKNFLSDLNKIWDNEIHRVEKKVDEKEVSFEQAINLLDYVFENLIITMVNTSKKAKELLPLNYDKEENETGKIFLVVGGNILSRGLTLYGLTVSYFLRTSSMYDTLLQMGRWFGFRNGYSDLPRIWTTQGLRDNFFHLAQVEQEIREEIRLYSNFSINPTNYKIRIRIIPNMQVTSRLKMKDAETNKRYNLNTKRSEVKKFESKNSDWLNHNIAAASNLVEKNLSNLKKLKHQYLLSNVKNQDIKNFFDTNEKFSFKIHSKEADINPTLVIKYISDLEKDDLLTDWNLVFDSKQNFSESLGSFKLSNSVILNCRNRSSILGKSHPIHFKHIASEMDYIADIKSEVEKAISDKSINTRLKLFNEEHGCNLSLNSEDKISREDMVIYRYLFAPTKGMLFFVPVSKNSTAEKFKNFQNVEAVEHILSFMIVFPPLNPRKEASSPTAQPLLRSNYISGRPDFNEIDEEFGELEIEDENEFDEEVD